MFEIADKHDHIVNLRAKNRRLEARLEHLERKVQFREKIIRELRRAPKNVMTQVDNNLGFIKWLHGYEGTVIVACSH